MDEQFLLLSTRKKERIEHLYKGKERTVRCEKVEKDGQDRERHSARMT